MELPAMRPLPDGKRWELLEPWLYAGKSDLFEVPSGYQTDLGTVPRAATWLVPRYGAAMTPASVLHDWLCDNIHWGSPIVGRSDADGLMRRQLRELGVSAPRRWAIWSAIRLGGKMRGAGLVEWLQVLAVSVVGVVTVGIPVALVQLWLVVIAIGEWLSRRIVR